mmetsp:Transcript_7426/g.13526  ORF Transcript_7426/g.13526 Transcript_7426/m.13526 type:complete len:107 (+) Transcript_7426:101-421(+)
MVYLCANEYQSRPSNKKVPMSADLFAPLYHKEFFVKTHRLCTNARRNIEKMLVFTIAQDKGRDHTHSSVDKPMWMAFQRRNTMESFELPGYLSFRDQSIAPTEAEK